MTPSVRLLNFTPQPIRTMALAARLCYSKGMTIEQVDKNLSDEQCEKLVGKILASGHLSVLEHSFFVMGIEGISRNCSHQLVRHRNSSYEQQSQHFTIVDDAAEIAMPAGLSDEHRAIWETTKTSAFLNYKKLIAEGVPKEEARHLLPGGTETKLVMSCNLRQWLHFVQIRSCVVNCQEILVIAHKVKKLLEAEMPMMRPHFGPTCWTDSICREGKKFCDAPWKDKCLVSGIGIPEPYIWERNK